MKTPSLPRRPWARLATCMTLGLSWQMACAGPAEPTAAGRAPVLTQDAASGAPLAELGLALLRTRTAQGGAMVNAVVSPYSVASALGLVHAGAAGATAQELAALFEGQDSAGRFFSALLPALNQQLDHPGTGKASFTMANRVWVDATVVRAIPVNYTALVRDRYKADAEVLPLNAQPEAARTSINTWVSQKTASRIPELMPQGSISANTKLVLTNAIHFKSPWAEVFNPEHTTPKAFHLANGSTKQVPTMSAEISVRQGTVGDYNVFDLPFVNNTFSLLIGMAPEGRTPDLSDAGLKGAGLMAWSRNLAPKTCHLLLPKFAIAPKSDSLKAPLMALGLRTVFGPSADLSPMLGAAVKGVMLDDVFQSATVTIDEQGGEAAAATGATAVSKGLSMPSPVCAIDRPFVFAILHTASGVPLFIGQVSDPSTL